MRSLKYHIHSGLSAHIDKDVVEDLISTYDELISKHRAGDFEGALTKAGRFVEHTLRAIEYLRTGSAPPEIKSVSTTIEVLRNSTTLPEPLKLLIPRVLYGMIYSIRSKRDAVHVKEIDPSQIDVSMSVSAASWVIAELLRIFHTSDEAAVSQCMLALTRTSIPYVEAIDGEVIVGQQVDSRTEVLLLLAHASPDGLTRSEIGKVAKCSASSVTRALQSLGADRLVHQSGSKKYHIMSNGEADLAIKLTEIRKRN